MPVSSALMGCNLRCSPVGNDLAHVFPSRLRCARLWVRLSQRGLDLSLEVTRKQVPPPRAQLTHNVRLLLSSRKEDQGGKHAGCSNPGQGVHTGRGDEGTAQRRTGSNTQLHR